MRYMMLLSGTNPATPPPPELFEAIMKLGGEATQAGVMLDTAGLLPSAAGARVSLTDGKVTVTDGPFTDSKELISFAPYDAELFGHWRYEGPTCIEEVVRGLAVAPGLVAVPASKSLERRGDLQR